jgi:hypothetical protein
LELGRQEYLKVVGALYKEANDHAVPAKREGQNMSKSKDIKSIEKDHPPKMETRIYDDLLKIG